MKKIISVMLLLALLSNYLTLVYATSNNNIESNGENYNVESGIEAEIINESGTDVKQEVIENESKEDNDLKISIGILNYLSLKTLDAAENKNLYDLIRINDIKDKINIRAFKNREIIDFYNKTFDPQITKLKGDNIMWDRIKEVYSEKKASAVRNAIKTAGEGVQNANVDSAAGMITSAIGTVTTTAISYLDAKAEAEAYMKDESTKKEINEMEIVDSINRDLFNTITIVGNEFDIDDNLLMRKPDIEDYIKSKNLSQVDARINALKGLERYAKGYPTYYLDLASSYFEKAVRDNNAEDYNNCIEYIHNYEKNGGLIFRERADVDYLRAIPYLVTSLKYAKNKNDYIDEADKYLSILSERLIKSDIDNWDLAYYIEIMYEDLYKVSGDKGYLNKGYEVAKSFIGSLSEKQREYNKQGSNYVMESLLYNVNNLFKYAKELNISQSEKKTIDNIIHSGGQERLFPVYPLDNYFWFNLPSAYENMEDLTNYLYLNIDDILVYLKELGQADDSFLKEAKTNKDNLSKEDVDYINDRLFKGIFKNKDQMSRDMQFEATDGGSIVFYVNKNLIDRNRSSVHLIREFNGEILGEYYGQGYSVYIFRDSNTNKRLGSHEVVNEKFKVNIINDYSDLGITLKTIDGVFNVNVQEEEVVNNGFFGIGKKTEIKKHYNFERVD